MNTSSNHQAFICTLLLTGLAIVSGCAGTKELEQVESRVDSQSIAIRQFQTQIAEQTKTIQSMQAQQAAYQSKLTQQWEGFNNAYNPEIRAELAGNLQTAQNHRDTVEKLKAAAQADRQHVADARKTGDSELALIKRNRKESEVQNVVNSFDQLASQFAALQKIVNQDLQQIQEESASHRASVQSSTRAATIAMDEAHKSRVAAEDAQENSRDVKRIKQQTKDVEDGLHHANQLINDLRDKLEKQQRENQSLKNRLQELERKIKAQS